MADTKTPRNADFVGRVVSDAKSPPETRLITGWFGDAAEKGYRRLYTDAELCAYIDIPADAILYTEAIRDVQPSGGVFVWIKRDADVKPGGSASSRAARFLQGQVQQDFSSPGGIERAGFHCVTRVPCGEPTGFTGQCTKQPEVGGAWPCITAIPYCSAPTGFTGQCTHQPWPNPTHYIGCTYLHCPTQDLTHIPHICNVVAAGMPGCPVVNPPQGGDPAAKAGAAEKGKEDGGGAERAAVPATSIPGCGYTQTWGLCETHLLGCGFTKQWGHCQPTQPPKCVVSVDIPCITRDLACGVTRNPACFANVVGGGFAAFRAAAPGPVIPDTQAPCSAVDTCPTRIGCETQLPTVYCTQFPDACPTDFKFCPHTTVPEACETCCGPKCQTQPPACTQCQCTLAGPQCPSPGFECTMFGPHCPTLQPAACPASQFGPACPTPTPPICFAPRQAGVQVGPIGPSAFVGCTHFGPQCFTYPNGDCTFFGCPTGTQVGAAGPGIGCTQSGPQCPTYAQPHCTCAGPGCPPTPATVCTQTGPQCPSQFGSGCRTDMQIDCTFGCTQIGTGCATTPQFACNANVAAARALVFGAAGPIGPIGPTGFRGCTVGAPNCPHPTIWTQLGPHCVTFPAGDCTFFGCPPTPATVCTQFAPCATHHRHCGGGGPSAVDACPTRICSTQQFCPSALDTCPTIACQVNTYYPGTSVGCSTSVGRGCWRTD